MKLQPITLSTQNYINTTPKKKACTDVCSRSEVGHFPIYYCPNINFNGSKFGSIDFEFDFFNKANNIINNHLDKMELTKDLSEKEQDDFRSKLFSCDKPTLLQFFYDKKPSILLCGDFPYLKANEKYDFVTRTISSRTKKGEIEISNTFVINKELTKQTISENKELYTKRMGLKDGASVDEIYKSLISEDSPLKKQDGYDDIIGITLGFSPINSILFQLERNIPNYLTVRKRPSYQAEQMDRRFHSETCVYKDFSPEFKDKVQTAINNMKKPMPRTPDISQIGYACIQFTPDMKHSEKIIKNSEEVLEKSKELVE